MKAPTISGANLFLMAHATTSRDAKEREAANKRLAELGITAQEALDEAQRRLAAGIPAGTAPN